ncbi:MAG: hypothetical protein ABI876_12935, partial [Bacteroidota bacterium]
SLEIARGYVLIANRGRWIWKRPIREVLPTTAETNEIAASSLQLEQNTPNPANQHAEINYVLPRADHVTLTLYDAEMRVTRTIVDADMNKGMHSVYVDTSVLPAGLYWYELVARGAVLTGKMVVVH